MEPVFPVYAIGDIHGRLDLLIKAQELIQRDANGGKALVICLGDYIDRGPQSSGVLSRLLISLDDRIKRVCLCGNHEIAFLDFLKNPQENLLWLEHGGRETLLSYGIDVDYFLRNKKKGLQELKSTLAEAVNPEHVNFLESMPISLRAGSFVFVHAGLRPGIPLEEQSDEDMLWIREPFLAQGFEEGITVVHGHTPVLEPEFTRGRVAIDTGAFATDRLTVLKIINGKASVLS